MKNIQIILLLIALLFTGCVTKTKIYKKKADEVNLILTTKSHDKYLFLGQKYQYLFEDFIEVNKLKELMQYAYGAESYKVKKKIYIDAYKNGMIHFYVTLRITPKDNQLLSIVKLGFKQNAKGSKGNNGEWSKTYELQGKISLIDFMLVKNYAQKRLENTYTTKITFQDDFEEKESLDIPKPNNGLVTLFWLVVLL